MTRMSFADKLGVLLNIINSSKEYVLVFFLLLFVGYILAATNKKTAKTTKRISLGIYAIIIGTIIYIYRDNLGKMFDYMMNDFFIIIYFPNLAVYLSAIIATNIIVWVSVFNFKIPRFIKNINITVYCLMTYLLILILNIISKNDLDVFTQASVYSNSDAQALIELSSAIFIIWLTFLIVYKVIKSLIIKQQPKPQLLQSTQQNYEKPTVKKVVQKPYRQIQPPRIVKANTTPIKTEKENINHYDDLLTLDEYKLLLNILKEQKAKEEQERNRQARIDKEQEKYHELQELYKSVL